MAVHGLKMHPLASFSDLPISMKHIPAISRSALRRPVAGAHQKPRDHRPASTAAKVRQDAAPSHPLTSGRHAAFKSYFSGASNYSQCVSRQLDVNRSILGSDRLRNAVRPHNLLEHAGPQTLSNSRRFSGLHGTGSRGVRPTGRVNHLSAILSGVRLRTIFGGSSSHNHLARVEQTANNNPSSSTAQNAFYLSLLRADMPAIVVERYQTGRYASNAACESIYERALERLAKTEGVGVGTGVGTGTQMQGAGNFSKDRLQAVGQAVAAQMTGATLAGPKAGSSGTGDKTAPLYVVVEESKGSTIFKWVKFLFNAALIVYLTSLFFSFAIEASGVLKSRGLQTQVSEATPKQQKARFSDVQGCTEAKEELQELVEFLKNPERFSALGGKLPKGVLLVGPPGTGKTLLARAVAGEAGVPFLYMSGSEFDEIFVGVGAKRVRDLFNAARSKAPAIIFIDELDAIGGKRQERDPAYAKQTLNQLLTELDGFSQDTGVIILAATNFPKSLDKALTRPGRFDRNVNVPLPDVRGRLEILTHKLKKVQVAPNVDAELIARTTPGFSGADIENLINQAAVRASRNKSAKVGMSEFEWAKDKIMMGAERRSAVITERDKLMTAYHEAGHALVAIYTQASMPVYKATIMPRGQALGLTHFVPDMDKVSQARKEMIAQIDVAMGGKVAEELIYGEDDVTSGCVADISSATRMAFRMVTQMGMSEALGNVDLATDYNSLSPSTKSLIESEMRRFVEEGRTRATTLLKDKRPELEILAKALVDYEVLNLEEIKKILKGEKLPRLTAVASARLKLPEMIIPQSLIGGPPSPEGRGRGGGNAAPVRTDREDGGGSGTAEC